VMRKSSHKQAHIVQVTLSTTDSSSFPMAVFLLVRVAQTNGVRGGVFPSDFCESAATSIWNAL